MRSTKLFVWLGRALGGGLPASHEGDIQISQRTSGGSTNVGLGMKFNIMRSANRQGRLATLTASVQMDFDNDLDVDSRLRQLFISRCEERGVAPIGRVLGRVPA